MGAPDSVIKNKISPFHITAFTVLLFAIILLFVDYRLAFTLVIIFILICITMPFATGYGFFLPVISKGNTGKKEIAITFDDGPDPDVTPSVLRLLSRKNIKATFFVTGQKASKHPEIIREIVKQGHAVANHSFSHDPLLMLRGKNSLYKEIMSTQDILAEQGVIPLAFRPPAGITNPRLRGALSGMGLYCVNWSARAFDAGNRRIDRLAEKLLKKVKPDDIILLHDVCPKYRGDIDKLLKEFEILFKGLENAGMRVVPLSELISSEVMKTTAD